MLLSCGVTPDGGILDETTLTCCSSWDSICATGTKSGHVYLWNILRVNEEASGISPDKELVPFCVLIPNSLCPVKLIGMVFILSPSPLLQSCTDELLLTLHSDNILRYWSLDNGRCIAQLSDSAEHEVLQLVSLADKRFILLVGHQRITIIDTWSRLNCGALKIASCPYSKRMVNNRIDEDTPDMYKIQSPNTVHFSYEDKNENPTLKPTYIYGEYGESMIFNVSTNHDYFELLKWSSNISLFDYCEDNKYPTAHFYTVAAMLNTGQVLVWDLSNLIRIWWHFIPIPHCEIPCPVPKPQKNNVPKPFMKYSQDEAGFTNSAKNASRSSLNYSHDQIILEDHLGELELKHEQIKPESSTEDINGSSFESYDHILELSSNASDHSKSSSFDFPNIYQFNSIRSPMLAPTFFSLHPCFVSEPINFYSIPSSEMFSTQIVVTDFYLIVNAKYRLIIWKRTFLPQFQNRNQRYQPFGDLFVPNTPVFEDSNLTNSQIETGIKNSCHGNDSKDSMYDVHQTPLKRATTLNIINQNTDNSETKQKLQIWLGFSQISLGIRQSCINKSKTFSPIRTLSMEYEEKQKHFVSFLAWSSDFTIYSIQIPSIVCFLFSQNFNPKYESNVTFSEHELGEIDNFGNYNDILAIPIYISRDYIRINDKDQLNYLGHLASYWQFFKINTLYENYIEESSKSSKNTDYNDQNHGNNEIIWVHRNNFRFLFEKSCETLPNTNFTYIEQNSDKIFYAFLDLSIVESQKKLPSYYEFPFIPNSNSFPNYYTSFNDPHSFVLNNVEISDSKNKFFPVKDNIESQKTIGTRNKTIMNRLTENKLYWKSTKSLRNVWEDDITDYDKKNNISVLSCCITEQKNSIYCIISLSNGKIMGQCLTGEFGLFSMMNCNEDKHFFGNIENGVVYQLPLPRSSCGHKTNVIEIKSITDGCIFGLTCCGNVLVWKVDLMENLFNKFTLGESINKDQHCNFNHNHNINSTKNKHSPGNKTQVISNNLFSLIAWIDGLFFTNMISLNKVIVFDVNRLGELGTPKYDKFQILVHSSLEKKCFLIKVNDNKINKITSKAESKSISRCIWDERKDKVNTECQGVTYEILSLSLETEKIQDPIESRINSVGIDKPSNFIFILQRDIVFVYDKDSCLLLAKISFNSILELKVSEYQNYHLSYGIMSSLNRFIQTSNRIEFLDHGVMFGSILIGYMPKLDFQQENFNQGCLGVRSSMSITFMAFNPHVSADVVSIEKKKQKNTKTSRYLQHLFPLFVRSNNEFLSKLFANMAPLTVRPILRFSTLITGVNYAISIPICNNLKKQTFDIKQTLRSKLRDKTDFCFNTSKKSNSGTRKRCESVDRSRNIYSGSRESRIRSHTYDGIGNPPYRYLVSENWSENIMRHLDIKTMSVRTLRNRLNISNNRNIISSCPGRPFFEWNRLPERKKNLEVDTNDYYIGELSGIPCTSHLVNRIVRSRNSGLNRKNSKLSQNLKVNLNSTTTLQRGETFDSRSLIKRDSTDNYENSISLFRSRTYESTLNFSNGLIQEFSTFEDSDQIWLERFLNQRNINEKFLGYKNQGEKTFEFEDSVESFNTCEFGNDLECQHEIESFRQDPSKEPQEHFSAHQLALQMVILHYYFTYYSNLDLPIQLLDKFLLSWIIEHVEQKRLLVRFIPFHLFSITGMTLDVFNPYLRLSAKYCLQLAIRSLPSELLSYCEEIAIDTLSGIIREFLRISGSTADKESKDETLHLLEQEVTTSSNSDFGGALCSTLGSEIKDIPPWNESCRRGHPKIYSYCSISLCRMIGYRLPFPIMNSGEYYCSNLSIEDLSLFFLSMVLYEHPFKRTHSSCIGKIILSFLISIITTYDIEIIIKFSKNFEKQQLEKKRLLKPIYARRNDTEQWYSWENLNIDSSKSNIIISSSSENFKNFGLSKISGYKGSLNYDANFYYNNISIMDTLRFLFALELFSLNFTSLLKAKNIENTCVPNLLRNSLTSWENNIFMAAHLFQVDNEDLKNNIEPQNNKKGMSTKVSNSIICLCIRLLTLAQYPPFWTSCRHLLQLIGQLDPKTYIYILGYAGRTAYPYMGINYTCNVLSLLVYFVSSLPEYSFPYLSMVVDISIGFLDPLDSTLRKGTITAVTSVLFILVSAFPMITFHQNTQRFAIGFDRSIIVYDLRTATKWRVLQGHTQQVDALCFNKEGEFLASYSIAEKALRIWQCTQSGLLGGLLGISGNCIKTIDLAEIPSRTLNCSLYYRLKVVKISCKNTDEWQLRRENKKTYTITIDKN
ncbi:WD repeats-containing protein [Cryptosporidium ubiquitum]|uniref:WD repeats-containing protein n=1 Tax=Cryptosporidium ubiquitum TaxID=857276 RepID=A0A1J4MM57_9CRYT|nr:WD repeats-containing protein [Cryptosporidium ubiquitum]OII74084.1 WD repeats-containing protein [Cryptosporidium ubiquitum]